MNAAREMIRIRPYSSIDRPFLEQGLNLILAEKAASSRDREIRPSPSWGRSYATFLFAGGRRKTLVARVAEIDRLRAGFAVASVDSGAPDWMLRSGAFSRRGTFLEVHVEPKFRGTAVGRRLVRDVESELGRRGCDWITASYHQGHRFESELYRGCGYKLNSVGVGRWLSPKRRASALAGPSP